MNTQFIMNYLSSLSMNNNREWYHANKDDYKKANAEFEKLLQTLILEIGKFDSSILHNNPKDLTFKIVRDTRFSHDKSPYNPAFRAHISSKGKLPVPVGYYLMIKPGNQSFLGGGLFADMFKDATAMIRNHISRNGEEWESIIHEPGFEKYFTVQGTELKRLLPGKRKGNGVHCGEDRHQKPHYEGHHDQGGDEYRRQIHRVLPARHRHRRDAAAGAGRRRNRRLNAEG